LVEIGSVVSEEKIFLISSPFFLRRPVSKMAAIIIIFFFSNGQNCSILSQKVPKFELHKHNDGHFNKYYEIFYEL
jgi:hypothetical protein